MILAAVGSADQQFRADRAEMIPQPGHQASFKIDGVERTRWHFGTQYPRPFFFPFRGPSGAILTRMGHPGAPNHDHHRSIWFAHHDVNGLDFWSDGKGTRIRQKTWYAYVDGKSEGIMASLLGWYTNEGKAVMEQELVAAIRPMKHDEYALEIQITLRAPAAAGAVELGKTNFGFLAVRVAKSLSVHFGGGELTSSEGQHGEPHIFGKRARWVDYSGPVSLGEGEQRRTVVEGITYFDHPGNPRYPSYWHVREDGWMGASFCMQRGYTIAADHPLVLRYLLYAHSGVCNQVRADGVHTDFAKRPGFEIRKSTRPHRQYEVQRIRSKE